MTRLVLDLSPIVTLTRSEFYRLCAANPDRRLERLNNGDLVVMAPTGGETGNRNWSLSGEFYLWCRQQGQGQGFDSSTGFALPDGSDRSPDLAWISQAKWDALTTEQRRGFLPLCPDFVVELMSPTDSWGRMQTKMEVYRANGCQLAWLIDPQGQRVAIYRADRPVEILERPASLSGEALLPGFLLDTAFLWPATSAPGG